MGAGAGGGKGEAVRPLKTLSMTRVWRIIEIAFGFAVPLVFAGPFVVVGLCLGIVLPVLGGEPTVFVLALCGALGLFALGNLLFSRKNLSRPQAERSIAGILAGIVPMVWFLRSGLVPKLRHCDKGALFWTTVLIPPAIVGLRRAVLLYKSLPASPAMDTFSD